MDVGKLRVLLGADISDFTRKMAEAEAQTSRLQRAFALGPATASSKMLAGGLLALGAATGVAAGGAVKMAAEYEQSKTAFTTLLGSGKEAEKFLKDLSDFASKTPFELPGLEDSSRRLLAFGFSAEKIIPMMTNIGNAVSALGGGKAEIDRVTLALGQMAAKGKISAEEMNQLNELGVKSWDMVAKAIGVSVPEAMKMAEQGMITGQQGIDAVLKGMAERFGGAMDKQSKTLIGRWSNLKDNISQMMRPLGEEIIKAFNLGPALDNINKWLGEIKTALEKGGLKGALAELFPEDLQKKIVIIGGAIAGALVPAIVAFGTSVAAAMIPLAPFMLAGAAVAALAYTIYKNWDKIGDFFKNIWTTVKDFTVNAVQAIVGFVQENWPLIISIILGPFGIIISAIISNWETIRDATTAAWEAITGALSTAWEAITGLATTAWTGLKDFFKKWGDEILQIAVGPVGWASLLSQHLGGIWESIKQGFADAWNGIKTIAESVWRGIVDTIKGGINSVIGLINRFIAAFNSIKIKVPEVQIPLDGTVGGWTVGMPQIPTIPYLAEGALVKSPTLAMIGEKGPEIVAPFQKFMDMIAPKLAFEGAGAPVTDYPISTKRGTTINHITITGNSISSDMDIHRIGELLVRELKRTGVTAGI
ncbi:MAG: tape measure protein [Bacillota bacterium]